MSASTPRSQRGGSNVRGARGSAMAAQPTRGSTRGTTTSARGRGRGRGTSSSPATTASGEGLLQKLRTGTVQRGSGDGMTLGGRGQRITSHEENGRLTTSEGRGTPRGSTTSTHRGRDHLSKTFNTPARSSSAPQSRSSSPAPPSSVRDFMNDVTARFQSVRSPSLLVG